MRGKLGASCQSFRIYLRGHIGSMTDMKKIVSALALSAVFIAAPSYAQSEAAKDAMEAAAEAASDAAEGRPPAVQAPRIPNTPRVRPPRLKTYRFINPADYPVDAWQDNETGVVGYKVDVSAEGRPSNCEVTEGSELKRLAPYTCTLVMERAEFRPARDENNEEVAGAFEGSHNWRKREPELPQMSLIFQYTHNEIGVSSDCKFLKMENLPEKMRKDIEREKERGKLCKGAFGSGRGVPYRDENGVPIARRVTVTMDVVLEEPVEEGPQ